MLTKDDVTNHIQDTNKDLAIDNTKASLSDLESIMEHITKPDATVNGIAFMFGSYYNDLKNQLNDVLEYLEK